jgi:hypothetical protein
MSRNYVKWFSKYCTFYFAVLKRGFNSINKRFHISSDHFLYPLKISSHKLECKQDKRKRSPCIDHHVYIDFKHFVTFVYGSIYFCKQKFLLLLTTVIMKWQLYIQKPFYTRIWLFRPLDIVCKRRITCIELVLF